MISARRLGQAVAGLCLTALFAAPVAHSRDRELFELTTPGFVVISDLSEKQTRRVAQDVEAFQKIVSIFTSAKDLTPKVPTRIYALSSRDWEQYARPWENVGGVFTESSFTNDMALDAETYGTATYRIVFHEYLHYVLHNTSAFSYPAWYEEGLAEALSTVEFSGDHVNVGKVPIERWITIDQRQWLPIKDVFAVRASSPEYRSHNVAFAFYAQSWALMHYGMFGGSGVLKRLNAYVKALSDGKSNEVAFAETMGMDYAELDRVLKRYARQQKFNYLAFNNKELVPMRTVELPIRKLSKDESAAEIGELALRLRHDPKPLQELFASVLKRSPDNMRATRGMALTLENLERGAEADELLTRALERSPGDATLQQAKAELLQKRVQAAWPPDGDISPAILADVMRLRELSRAPARASKTAYDMIYLHAWTYTHGEGDNAEALALLEAAREELPKSGELAYVAALLHARNGSARRSHAAWLDVVANARSLELRNEAQRALANESVPGR